MLSYKLYNALLSPLPDFIRIFRSPLIGGRFFNFLRLLFNSGVSPRMYIGIIILLLIASILEILRIPHYIQFYMKSKKHDSSKVIFIIGFWRSGTTHLHNLMCQDPQMCFVSTFRSIFPDSLVFDGLIKKAVGIIIPRKRFSDNLKLHVDLPQEEEFCFYHPKTIDRQEKQNEFYGTI